MNKKYDFYLYILKRDTTPFVTRFADLRFGYVIAFAIRVRLIF